MGAGVSFLEASFTTRCWTTSHWTWAVSVGGLIFVLYAVGIPAVTAFLLFKAHRRDETQDAAALGFLSNGFHDEFYYWECVGMTRKVRVCGSTHTRSCFTDAVATHTYV